MTHSYSRNEDDRRARLAGSLEMLAGAHVMFPAAIVTVAVAMFMAGHAMNRWVVVSAAVIVLAGLRAFGAPLRDAALIVALAVALHIVAGLIAVVLPDQSWDGLTYHQEAVLRLASGWNPLFEHARAQGWAHASYLDHYPNAFWIAATGVFLNTGFVESGKLFNLTLMLAAAALVTAALLRLTRLHILHATALGLLVAMNPVAICQSQTFYVDGALASLLTILIAGVTVFIATGRWPPLGVALVATCLVMNLKFTGWVYAAVLMALAIPISWWWHGVTTASRIAAAAGVTILVGSLFLGYVPYVRNIVEQGDPFYPMSPRLRLDNLTYQRPVNLSDRNRVSRFLISNFSQTEALRPPRGTRLKFPFWITDEERSSAYPADLESGGFGPLYGGLLVLATIAGLARVAHPSRRRGAGAAILIACCVLASVFVHAETWWARFVPQAWLLPMVLAVPGLCALRRSPQWWLGSSIVALATVNLLLVGSSVARREWVAARNIRTGLREMSAAPQPVTVYFGPFSSLRRRLTEAGIRFRVIDMPPQAHDVRHTIPAPGDQAFWWPPR